MDLKFKNKKITGILTILPQRVVTFEEEMGNYNFPEKKSLRLKKVMGYKTHRIAAEGQCSSDFCIWGLHYLFENNMLKRMRLMQFCLYPSHPTIICLLQVISFRVISI